PPKKAPPGGAGTPPGRPGDRTTRGCNLPTKLPGGHADCNRWPNIFLGRHEPAPASGPRSNSSKNRPPRSRGCHALVRAGDRPRPPSRGPRPTELTEGAEFPFSLAPHPAGALYAMPHLSPPLPVEGDDGKKNVETARKVAAALADPTKGLTSDRPYDRYFTAA